MKKKTKTFHDAFAEHGVEFASHAGKEATGDCPFCGKENHFFANAETGQWDCKVCGERGNIVTFLTKRAEQLARETSSADYRLLAKGRGLPPEAFRAWRLGWDGRQWIIPTFSETGTCRDLRRWAGEGAGVYSTACCKVQMLGLEKLITANADPLAKKLPVWLCEGEWDAIALHYLLRRAGVPDLVVARPGATTFKEDWAPHFRDRLVLCCDDNDEAGDRGAELADKRLAGIAKEVTFLSWPDTMPEGWDIRDHVRDGLAKGKKCKAILAELLPLFRTRPRRDPAGTGASSQKAAAVLAKPKFAKAPAYADVLKAFRRWLEMDQDMEDGLAVTAAVARSVHAPGDPLWLQMVAPPGGGKTAILNAFQGSEHVVFRSTLTPASLVSGFKGEKGGPDPSLLPRLQGKCAVFKDGTEILSLPINAKNEIYATLRGAFDGHVTKSFGNGIERNYQGLRFNILMGMTPAVHADSQASMGERFLKFQMMKGNFSADAQIAAALRNVTHESQAQEELQNVLGAFLDQPYDPAETPPAPEWAVRRLIALAQIVSRLRARVAREAYGERELVARPSFECGTRIAKQSAKLGMFLCWVFGLKEWDENVYRLVERVAFDSSIGFHLDAVTALMRAGGSAAAKEVSALAHLPRTNMSRKLEDLELLGVVRYQEGETFTLPSGHESRRPGIWYVDKGMVRLWERAEVKAEGYELRAAEGRRKRDWKVKP